MPFPASRLTWNSSQEISPEFWSSSKIFRTRTGTKFRFLFSLVFVRRANAILKSFRLNHLVTLFSELKSLTLGHFWSTWSQMAKNGKTRFCPKFPGFLVRSSLVRKQSLVHFGTRISRLGSQTKKSKSRRNYYIKVKTDTTVNEN